ncbi:MAG: GNAT family N-acetyltransferase [Woeseiaceae bacterium]|nr:GNAT family N-acetyltransferase [Woeseiaceae bacterium]
MFTVRIAKPRDAKVLSQFAESIFRATYGAMNTAGHMATHCHNSFGEQIQAAEISNPDMVTVLSEDKDTLIGYALLLWGEAPDFVSSKKPGEIQQASIVGDDWHGRRGTGLMDACIDEMRQRGSDVVWLGVLESAIRRALAFYKKRGFIEVGEQIFSFGGDPQRDIVMARSIASVEATMDRGQRGDN